MKNWLCFSIIAPALLLPVTASAISVTSPGSLGPTDFWTYIDATNGALSLLEDRGTAPVSVDIQNPVIGGTTVTGDLSAGSNVTSTGPTSSVNANLSYSGAAAFDTDIDLRSIVSFDLAALGTGATANVRIQGDGIGGVTGNFFGQFGQASSTVSGFITLYETTPSGGYGSIIDSWSIPGNFTTTLIDQVLTLNVNELYKVVVRSSADIRLFNVADFNLSAYMIVDPVFTSETAGVNVFVSPGASPVPLPGTLVLLASGISGLVWRARRRKAA